MLITKEHFDSNNLFTSLIANNSTTFTGFSQRTLNESRLQIFNTIIPASKSCAVWTIGRIGPTLSLLGNQQLVAQPEEEGSILWTKSSQSCQSP